MGRGRLEKNDWKEVSLSELGGTDKHKDQHQLQLPHCAHASIFFGGPDAASARWQPRKKSKKSISFLIIVIIIIMAYYCHYRHNNGDFLRKIRNIEFCTSFPK